MSSAFCSKLPNISFSVCDSVEEAKNTFTQNIEFRAKTSIITRNTFRIGVSGGSLIKLLAEDILPKIQTDFSKWRIYFCDERMVPYDHPESTYGCYKSLLLGKFKGLTEESFVPVNTSLSVDEAAKDYEATLRSHFPYEFKDPLPDGQKHFPRFDCLLLGLGPDGHTCSLFPGHPLMKEKDLWIAPIKDSPKPPPERVTITYPVIHKARNIQLYLTGAGKADIIKRIIMDCERLPGFYINTTEPNCDVQWILDTESAKLIPEQTPLLQEIADGFEKHGHNTPKFAPGWHNPDDRDIAY